MKIAIFSNCPLVESQGSGYVILNFARGLRAKGHHVDLFGPETYETLAFVKAAQFHRRTLGMAIRAVRELCRTNYDLVEFYGAEAWLAAALLRKWPGRRWLLVSHSNGLRGGRNSTLDGAPRKWYQRLLRPPIEKAFTKVDGLVTVSHYDRDYALENRYQDSAHVLAVENSLPETYMGLEVDFSRPQVVGYCGSWLANKGRRIIELDMPKLLEEFPQASLKLVGVGKSFVKESHFPRELCSRIDVIPFVEDKRELQRIYMSMAVFMLPSVGEGFGLVAAEAMACGCALVAYKSGLAYSLADREEVLRMSEPRSPFLYGAVRELFLDDELRARIARAGYRRVQTLRWESAVDSLNETYQSWLQEFRLKAGGGIQ